MALTVQQHFTNLDTFEGMKCVEVHDKHSGLKFLLLNLLDDMCLCIIFSCAVSAHTYLSFSTDITAKSTNDTRSKEKKGN